MLGLLVLVVLVSVVYEVLLVASVVVGTRLRLAAGTAAPVEPAGTAVGEPVAPEPPAVPPVRASDRERDVAASRIADAMAEGRLAVEDGVARIEAACGARDRAQLAMLVADLPAAAAGVPPRGRVPGLRTVALVVGVGAVVLQVLTGSWVLWPVAVVLLLLPLGRRQPGHG